MVATQSLPENKGILRANRNDQSAAKAKSGRKGQKHFSSCKIAVDGAGIAVLRNKKIELS
jgi:hypothetical protein